MKTLVLFMAMVGTAYAGEIAPRSGWSFAEAAKIPVQAGGRVKPLDSYARDVALFITGSRSFQGWDSIELMMSWITEPQDWGSRPFIQLTRADAKRQLGLEEQRSRFSPDEMIHSSYLAQYAEELSRPLPPGVKASAREQELRRVLERIGLYRHVVSGEAWPIVPASGGRPGAQWGMLTDTSRSAGDGKAPHAAVLDGPRKPFAAMLLAYRAGDRPGFEAAARAARGAIEGATPSWDASFSRVISAEVFYNRARPFLAAWILYLLSLACWSAAAAFTRGKAPARLRVAALTAVGAGAFSHVGGIALRCYIAGRPPVSNMYESVIWVTFGAVVFATILYFLNKKQSVLLATSCGVAALGLIAADLAPAIMDPSIHPLVPVLRSNFWLTIHVLTITLSYAAFLLTLGLGDVTLWLFWRGGAHAQQRITALNQLTYRAMQIGVVLVAAGTILGGVWADYSWGRFWGWDPKEVWALIVLLGYVMVLHARYAGWIGTFGFPAATVASFLTVLMAWYGVNFVLGQGLHSYGFSSGGQAFVGGFVALHLAYVAAVAWKRKQKKR